MTDLNPFRVKLVEASHYLGLVVAMIGGLSMFLRVLGPLQWTGFLPHFVAACAIFLCASALALPQRGISHRRLHIKQGLALAAIALAFLTLMVYAGWGFPQGLGQQKWMMSPVASVVVLIVAASILCLQHTRIHALAQSLAIFGLTICLLALLGYMQGVLTLAELGTAFPMTIPTAVLLSMLSLSVLCARPEAGMMEVATSATSAGSVVRRLMLPLIFLTVLLSFIIQVVAQRGWYASGLMNAIFIFAIMVMIALLTGWQALTLYRSDFQRRQLELQAQEAEERHTRLVQSVTDYALDTLDPEGRIISWNTGSEQIRGYTEAEILGHSYAEFFPPELVEAGLPQCLLETARREGRVVDEGWQIRKDGTRFYANTILTRVDDVQGQLLGFAKVTRDISAQKQAVAEQVKLQSILDTVLDPLLVIDNVGRVETFNPAAERVFGYRAEEVMGRNVSLLMPSPDRERHDDYLRRYRETGEAHVIGIGRNITARRKDGSIFPAELSVSEMCVDGQQKFTGIVRDISVRKAAEAALKNSETRLNLALEAGNIAVWELDMETERMRATGSLFESLVLPEGDAIKLGDWLSLNHPDDQVFMRDQFEQIAHGQRNVAEMEHRLRTMQGAWYWLLSRGTVSRRDKKGQALRMHGTTIDIHERKTTEEALRKSRLDLDIALKAAAFHLWHFHVKEQCLVDLDALIEALGYTRSSETLKLAFWQSLLHPDDLAYWRTRSLLPLPDVLQEDGVELRLRAKDGSWHWMLTRARVVDVDKQGRPILIVGTCIDITASKTQAEQLLHAAQHDALTGLPNRELSYAFGERVLEAAHRHGHQCAVLFVDLDRFKPINDIYGHAAGDTVLHEIGQRLERCVRGEDVVGRLGGDEFLLILADILKIEDIIRIANNCLAALECRILYHELELQISCSIGISLYPSDARNMDTLLKHADTAMYHAKKEGKNNFQFFTPDMNARAESLQKLECRLRRAVEQKALCLHYQPVVDTTNHRIVGAEVLLRWPSANIGPEEFIPIAESSGLILPIGDWVLYEACRQQKSWVEKGLTPIKVSVNVSPLQFRDQQFTERVARIIVETGINPAHLQLEITENAFMIDFSVVVRTLNALREMGLSIALDDFGKDYSSLNYLKSLPLDAVKVDKDFVHELQGDRVNLAITEAIINLGASLGLQVIAEGIETEEVLQLLRTKRCHHMQGFFLSHPLPPTEFEAWCRDPSAPGRAYQH